MSAAVHCLRHPDVADNNMLLQELPDVKRSQERPIKTYIDILNNDVNVNTKEELVNRMEIRKEWRERRQARLWAT